MVKTHPCNMTPKNETCIIDVNNISLVNKYINTNILTLYYDGSKKRDGAGASCILMDPIKNNISISCHSKS